MTSGLLFLAAVAAAVVFRMLLPPAQRTNESSDYRDFYAPVAQQILAGSGPTVPDSGGPAVRYPPGYPALLAAAFAIARGVGVTDERGAIVLGVLAAGVVAALLERIASAAWEPRIAWVAGLAWLTYPLALWLTKQPCSELPFMVLLVAAVGLAWRALHGARPAASCAMAGVLVGLAMLVRPIAIGTGVVLGAALVLAGRGWKRLRARVALGTLLVLASIVTVLPWELWVYERTGRVVALSTAGVSSIADGLLLTDTTKEYRHVAGVPSDVAAVIDDIRRSADRIGSTSGAVAIVAHEARERPVAAAKLLGLKAIRSWYGTDSGRYEAAVAAIQIVYVGLALGGAWIAWTAGGRPRTLAVFVGLLTLYFWAMTVTVLSIARYMVPAIGLAFVLVPGVVARLRRGPASVP